ncbi:MAG: DUF5063 domain-containing protein [Steroidobacteraceae bacterium]
MTQSDAIAQFEKHARQFVKWCKTDHDGAAPKQFKVEALRHLSSVYNSALYLPEVEFKRSPEAPRTTDVQRQVVAQNLSALPFQYYWVLCEPALPDTDTEPGCGDLFDDFQDIYADISSGLWLFDAGHVEAAVYSWREMFRLHWGPHVVSALHALHSFEYGE